LQVIATSPTVNGGPWSARAVVHPHPLYGIEGEPARSGNGLYDKMHPVGAHEVIVENSRHDRQLWNADDREIEEYLALCGQRIQDLKGDVRFKYVTVFKNFGGMSGQEFDHPTSEIIATTFVPRRVLYELRSAREHYRVKERCVFCDILRQEQEQKQRVIEVRGEYMASCPYAPRVPYEVWIAPRTHDAYFERTAMKSGAMRDFAALLRRTLFRIRTIADGFHMVLHTSPNTLHKSETLGFWKTIEDDYHWHLEILPILGAKGKSYTFKEVYYSPVSSETSAAILRERPTE
jgi:UDPglucose--hexose-1-phosphate uridylyltransferase